jgi:hypothetical protein
MNRILMAAQWLSWCSTGTTSLLKSDNPRLLWNNINSRHKVELSRLPSGSYDCWAISRLTYHTALQVGNLCRTLEKTDCGVHSQSLFSINIISQHLVFMLLSIIYRPDTLTGVTVHYVRYYWTARAVEGRRKDVRCNYSTTNSLGLHTE